MYSDWPHLETMEKTASPRRSPRSEMEKVQVAEKKRVRRSPRLRKVAEEEGLDRRNLSSLQSPVSKMRKMHPKRIRMRWLLILAMNQLSKCF